MRFLPKLPTLRQVLPLYAVISTSVYAWSLLQFFWRLPSWTFFAPLDEILSILAYLLIANFIESLLLFGMVFGIFFLLPAALTRDQWVVKSVLFAVAGVSFLVYRNNFFYPDQVLYAIPPLEFALLLLTGILLIAFPFAKFPAFCRFIEDLADRFIIFLYISLPLSALALLVIIGRNIF